jgi:hypothetical protein
MAQGGQLCVDDIDLGAVIANLIVSVDCAR